MRYPYRGGHRASGRSAAGRDPSANLRPGAVRHREATGGGQHIISFCLARFLVTWGGYQGAELPWHAPCAAQWGSEPPADLAPWASEPSAVRRLVAESTWV